MLTLILSVSSLATALVGGAFMVFSDFLMRALAATGPEPAMRSMQMINLAVFRWVFMSLFLGLAAASLLLLLYAGLWLHGQLQGLVMAASLIYLLGCFGVTALFNVPMNETLAALDPHSAAAQRYWTETYLPRWTRWNSLRAIACVLSSGLLLIAISWGIAVR